MDRTKKILVAIAVAAMAGSATTPAVAGEGQNARAAEVTPAGGRGKCDHYNSSSRPFRRAPNVAVGVSVNVCISKTGGNPGTYYATTRTNWYGGFLIPGVKRFDEFSVHLRLEKNNGNKQTIVCDLTRDINTHKWSNGTARKCMQDGYVGSAGGWSSDGYVVYDYDGDGKGDRKWQLKGSPAIN
ncbi:hypothetical protein [Streptomyces sp. bgisy100]|uniref:hypothetical protein n=1 Tax=Streptomyces sp. bgisy100 TaxID=3413783 RepID=UPI003D74C7E4